MNSISELVRREEVCSVAAARRVAAMLDLDPATYPEGTALPRGWHFFLLAADTRRSEIRQDGFAGLGVPMPDLGLPRLLLGARTVCWRGDIPIGASLLRESTIRDIAHKVTKSGPMALVTVAHALRVAGDTEPALEETQTYMLLPQREPGAEAERATPAVTVQADRTSTVVPDETMLFQYSALGFNTHKIHIDKSYARDVEGFPDLVVNGGLTTLLLTEFLRRDLGVAPVVMKARYLAPLFCRRQVTLGADRAEAGWQLRAFNDNGRPAVEMEIDIQ